MAARGIRTELLGLRFQNSTAELHRKDSYLLGQKVRHIPQSFVRQMMEDLRPTTD